MDALLDATLMWLNRAIDDGTFFVILIGGTLGGMFLYGFVQGLRGKTSPKRASIGEAIAILNKPGGMFYERNEAVRQMLERRGLTFQYSDYRASPIGSQQLRDFGGPFRLLTHVLSDVYRGSPDGLDVTVGDYMVGDVDNHEERMVAIVRFAALTFPTFTAAPRAHWRHAKGDRLTLPKHPQLAKTHRIFGDDAARRVLTDAILDRLTREPGWGLEGKDNTLLICRFTPPPNGSAYLTAEEITRFVDDALRIANLFNSRFTTVHSPYTR